jgi:hypothetical protein
LVRSCTFFIIILSSVSIQLSSNSQRRILFIRRIVQFWYNRIGDAEGEDYFYLYIILFGDVEFTLEKTVQTLMEERLEKVEEVKKKTNYYYSHDLIHRYESYDETSPATPLPPIVNAGLPLPVTPQQQQPFPSNYNLSSNGKAAMNPALQAQISRPSSIPSSRLFQPFSFSFFFPPNSYLTFRRATSTTTMVQSTRTLDLGRRRSQYCFPKFSLCPDL